MKGSAVFYVGQRGDFFRMTRKKSRHIRVPDSSGPIFHGVWQSLHPMIFARYHLVERPGWMRRGLRGGLLCLAALEGDDADAGAGKRDDDCVQDGPLRNSMHACPSCEACYLSLLNATSALEPRKTGVRRDAGRGSTVAVQVEYRGGECRAKGHECFLERHPPDRARVPADTVLHLCCRRDLGDRHRLDDHHLQRARCRGPASASVPQASRARGGRATSARHGRAALGVAAQLFRPPGTEQRVRSRRRLRHAKREHLGSRRRTRKDPGRQRLARVVRRAGRCARDRSSVDRR